MFRPLPFAGQVVFSLPCCCGLDSKEALDAGSKLRV